VLLKLIFGRRKKFLKRREGNISSSYNKTTLTPPSEIHIMQLKTKMWFFLPPGTIQGREINVK
jgi:hypothetical protein